MRFEVPLMDLGAQLAAIRGEVDGAIRRVVESGAFVRGPDVGAFETEFAAYCGAPHAVAVANGTDALGLTLRALGVGPGDEVIVPTFTFIATAECVSHLGATPVFADVDPEDYTLDPASVREKITGRTRALIPVHLFGHPADMDPLCALARERGLFVVEDAAQAHGAAYKGRRAGVLGDAAAFSFYPSKNLGALGDAGVVVTRDPDLAARLRLLHDHGSPREDKYRHAVVGCNSRMDTLQAAVLRVKLRRLDGWNDARAALAARYLELLSDVPGLALPRARPWARHVYHLFVARAEDRDRAVAGLRAEGVDARPYYARCVHEQAAYAENASGALPRASALAREVVALPLFPGMRPDQQDFVARAVRKVLGG